MEREELFLLEKGVHVGGLRQSCYCSSIWSTIKIKLHEMPQDVRFLQAYSMRVNEL